MQIDFHHAVTYVVCRLAGLSARDAGVVAYAAQYVDDATNTGTVRFSNGAMYHRLSSAHRTFDYRNLEELARQQVWIPFHFMPGNGGAPAGEDPPGKFIEKLVCRPDSPPARDMVRLAIAKRGAAHALHRLGITLHTYCDTWAHQGFAGVSHRVNHAEDLRGPDGEPDERIMTKLQNFFVRQTLPLGHGAVLGNPDKPYLVWSYTDGEGRRVERDNPRDYLAAMDAVARVVRRFVLGDPDADVPGLHPDDLAQIDHYLRAIDDHDDHARHERWMEAVRRGHFRFGAEPLEYHPKGEGSWKHVALGTVTEDDDDEESAYEYSPEFFRCDWKLFHDALQRQRLDIVQVVLPRYGICVA